MKIGIVGLGHVGSSLAELFTQAVGYDEPKGIGTKEEINACDIVFVCVPTPSTLSGKCDTSIVENVLSWINTDLIVIRSTIPVGFIDQQEKLLNKNIVFQPEYYGETPAHPFANPHNRNWITLGGRREIMDNAIQAYQQVFTSELIINIVDAKTAELAKYMENCFLATKVTFCNEFYDIAAAFGVDYNQLRETWLLDPRIGRSHTFVYKTARGYGGNCLPKDIAALVYQTEQLGVNCGLLNSVIQRNDIFHKKTQLP